MRGIKFRAKRIDNGDWVYGYLTRSSKDGSYRIEKFKGDEFITLDTVTEETVGQFTGMKDKNGKDIYEGDITEENAIQSYVYYNEEEACFAGKDVIPGECECWISKTSEIIGNLYDNPDLLK